MNLLQALSLIWVVAVVLVLAVTVIGTALALRSAKNHLKGVADDLELIAQRAAPLEPKLSSIGQNLGGVAGSLTRVDAGLGQILGVVGGLIQAKHAEKKG